MATDLLNPITELRAAEWRSGEDPFRPPHPSSEQPPVRVDRVFGATIRVDIYVNGNLSKNLTRPIGPSPKFLVSLSF